MAQPMLVSDIPDPCNLEVEGEWLEVEGLGALSVATGPDDRWRDYPHIAQGRKAWAQRMGPRAKLFYDKVRQHLYPAPTCSLCPHEAYLPDDISGPKHWSRTWVPLERHTVGELVPYAWNESPLEGGKIRFNELDGRIQIMRSCQQPPPHRLRYAPPVALATGEPRVPGEIQAPRSEVSKEKEEDHKDVASTLGHAEGSPGASFDAAELSADRLRRLCMWRLSMLDRSEVQQQWSSIVGSTRAALMASRFQ